VVLDRNAFIANFVPPLHAMVFTHAIGSLLVMTCRFESNHGTVVVSDGDVVVMYGSDIVGNSADLVNQAFVWGGYEQLFVVKNRFVRNYFVGDGPPSLTGALIWGDGALRVVPNRIESRFNIFAENDPLSKGPILVQGGVVFDYNSLYYGNGSELVNGSVMVISGTLNMKKSHVYYGYAHDGNSALYLNTSLAVIHDCTFANNGRPLEKGFEEFFSGFADRNSFEPPSNVLVENLPADVQTILKSYVDSLQNLAATPGSGPIPTVARTPSLRISRVKPPYTSSGLRAMVAVTLEVRGSIFKNNLSVQTSGLHYEWCLNKKGMIIDTIFEDNEATGSLPLAVIDCDITFQNVIIRRNRGATLSDGLLIESGSLTASNLIMEAQGGTEKTAYLVVLASSATITSSSFRNAHGSNSIVARYTDSLTFDGCIFENLVSQTTNGAIMVYNSKSVIIKNSKFRGNQAGGMASDMFLQQIQHIEIQNSVFQNFGTSGSVKITSSNQIILTESIFYDSLGKSAQLLTQPSNHDETALTRKNLLESVPLNSKESYMGLPQSVESRFTEFSALTLVDFESVSLQSMVFSDLCAYSGGALSLSGDTNIESHLKIEASIFRNSISLKNGGAINISDVRILEINGSSQFSGNTASQGSGGAVYATCGQDDCQWTIGENSSDPTTFSTNSADGNGGAIYWQGSKPQLNNLAILRGENNRASYGKFVASQPFRIVHISDMSWIGQGFIGEEIDFLGNHGTESEELLIEAGSGIDLERDLNFGIVDIYGQILTSDSKSWAIITTSDLDVEIKNSSRTAISGVFNFRGLNVATSQGADLTLKIDVTIAYDQSNIDFPLKMHIRKCQKGEIFISASRRCLPCGSVSIDVDDDSKLYSLDAEDAECKVCPKHARCWGGANIGPAPGYWRTNRDSDEFHQCTIKEACLGATSLENKDEHGECDSAAGYEGILCGSCAKDHILTAEYTCTKCPSLTITLLSASLTVIAVLTVMIILIRSSLKSVTHKKSVFSIYLKIFANYIQLMVLASSFKAQWPDEVRSLFRAHYRVSAFSDQIPQFSCLLPESNPKRVFSTLLLSATTPIMALVASVLAWSLIWLVTKLTRHEAANRMIMTVIVIVFCLHPMIISRNLAMFQCQDVSGSSYLRSDYSVECWSSEHSTWTFNVALPAIILWGLGIPTAGLMILVRHRHDLFVQQTRTRYGFLFMGYKPEVFYWEVVIVYRKVAMAALMVYSNRWEGQVPVLVGIGFLLLSLYLHNAAGPFVSAELNKMESFAISLPTLSLYCGIMYTSTNISSSGRLVLFLLMVLANLAFVLLWIAKSCESLLRKVRDRVRRFSVSNVVAFEPVTPTPNDDTSRCHLVAQPELTFRKTKNIL